MVALDDHPHDGRVTSGERDDVRVENVSLPSHTARGDEIPLHADDGERDAVRCGLGADVAFADAIDSLRDCETVHGRGQPRGL